MAGIKEYFSFSKRERAGVLVLTALILGVYFLPAFFPTPKSVLDPKSVAEIREQMAALKKMEIDTQASVTSRQENEDYISNHESPDHGSKKIVLFDFDPNTLPPDGWKKLGISDRTVQTIGKYISKGGKFRKPEDIKKIFGLRNEQYEQLLPFVRIQNSDDKKPGPNAPIYNSGITHFPAIVDINTADTSMLIALPGIGSRLANRILHFRDRLGGFYSTEQVRETFGLPDSTFQKIKPFLRCVNSNIQRININIADVDRLKNHPYIKWNVANAIVNYRQQHGNYLATEDLLKIDIIPPETLQKLIPYLVVD